MSAKPSVEEVLRVLWCAVEQAGGCILVDRRVEERYVKLKCTVEVGIAEDGRLVVQTHKGPKA